MDNTNNPPRQHHQPLPYPPAPPATADAAAAARFNHILQQELHMFWYLQRQEIEQVNDFKNHQLPLARIKKIMKFDQDVFMISAEALVLFAKACELFILELTFRSWLHAQENGRLILQKNDIAAAIKQTNIYCFLVEDSPRDEAAGLGAGIGGMIGGAGSAEGGVPVIDPSAGGMMIGEGGVPAIDPSAVYGQPSQETAWQNAAPGPDDGSYGGGINGQDTDS